MTCGVNSHGHGIFGSRSKIVASLGAGGETRPGARESVSSASPRAGPAPSTAPCRRLWFFKKTREFSHRQEPVYEALPGCRTPPRDPLSQARRVVVVVGGRTRGARTGLLARENLRDRRLDVARVRRPHRLTCEVATRTLSTNRERARSLPQRSTLIISSKSCSRTHTHTHTYLEEECTRTCGDASPAAVSI